MSVEAGARMVLRGRVGTTEARGGLFILNKWSGYGSIVDAPDKGTITRRRGSCGGASVHGARTEVWVVLTKYIFGNAERDLCDRGHS